MGPAPDYQQDRHPAYEDRTLLAELPGYRAYAARVRYRLIPGIW